MEIAEIAKEDILYLDESGFDMNMQKEYGWESRDKRLIADRSGNKGIRETVIAVRDHNHDILASFRFEGYTNKEIFKQYLTEVLLPLIQGKTIILDNAKFHKGSDIEDLVRLSGNKIKYLPPYSPDLNPIEKKWAQLKKLYRKLTYKFKNKIMLLDILLSGRNYQPFC